MAIRDIGDNVRALREGRPPFRRISKLSSRYQRSEKVTESLERKLLRWLLSGGGGLSAKAIAAAAVGLEEWETCGIIHHPHDGPDFARCLDLVRSIPEAGRGVARLADRDPCWRKLRDMWHRLERWQEEGLERRVDRAVTDIHVSHGIGDAPSRNLQREVDRYEDALCEIERRAREVRIRD